MIFIALIRFIFFIMPDAFIGGLSWILFDKQEVIGTNFSVRRLRDKHHKEKIIKDYLEKCCKEVHKQKD